MAEGFVFLHLFKSNVSSRRFKVEKSAKQRNSAERQKLNYLDLGFPDPFIHILCATFVPDLTVNALYSRGRKGKVRFALTPVQIHQRSLTAHWSRAAHTPIWPLLHFPLITMVLGRAWEGK